MKIYSVEYINHYIKDLVNNEFKYPIAIKGEMNDLNKNQTQKRKEQDTGQERKH